MNKLLLICIIIVLIVLLYLFYTFFIVKRPAHNVLIDQPVYLTQDYNSFISIDKLPPSNTGRKYTYAFWIYIKNVPENTIWNSDFQHEKIILFHYGSPNIYYIPKKHELKISIFYKNNMNEKESYDFILDNLESQNWIHVGLTVNNKNVDVYLDGELHASTILNNIPWIPNKYMYIGEKNNNFNGYLYYLEYINTDLGIEDMRDLYNKTKNTTPNSLVTYSEVFNNKNKKNN